MKHFYALLLFVFIAFSAKSQCTFSIPFTENFDGSSWVTAPSWNTTGSINTCWTRNPTSTGPYVWIPGPPFLTNTLTGPTGDHTSGSGKFMYLNSLGAASPPDNGVLLTPFISLVGSTAPELNFWYHMYGAGIGSLRVEVSNGGAWVVLQTKSGQQHNSAAQAYTKMNVDLSSYVGDTIRIRFVGVKTTFNGNARIAIDDVSIAETPTCTAPTNVYTTGTTASSTTVGWTVNPTATFEIEYGPSGFAHGSGTIIPATSNPQLISGLNGSTTYDFYVRELCTPTDISAWSGPGTTTTACSGPLVPPYTENFDSPNWEAYTNFNNQGSLGPCWTKNPNLSGYEWHVNPNPFFSNQTGPNGDHTTGFGKYLGAQRIIGSTNNSVAILRSPQIDLSTTNNPELTFWYHMFGSQINRLEVQVLRLSGGSFTTIHTITGQQQSNSNSPWQSVNLSLQAYSNDTIYLRFRGIATQAFPFSAKISIDDISIVAGSSCPKPLNFTATNILSSTVDLSWLGGTTGSYEINYGAPGFNPNIAGTSVLAAASPQTVTGLTPGTTYEFYVRKLCVSPSDSSNWAGPITVMTACITSAPYLQNFDSANWTVPPNTLTNGTIDPCWDRSEVNLYVWTPGPEQFSSFNTGPAADHTTGNGKFMFTNSVSFGGTAPIIATLETELIDLTPLTIPELSFWYHMFGNQIGTLKVEVNNGGGWTQVYTKTGQQHTSKTDPWSEAIVNLSSYANDTIRLRFTGSKAVNTFNSEIAIDDVNIHEQPSCPKPSNLAAVSVTFNSANVGWTTGGASDWIIKYGAPGFTSGTFISTSSNPNDITSLSANTDYEIWVRDSCGVGDVSDWVGPITIRTHCSPTTAPFSEDFDGSNFSVWTFTNQPGVIDDCYRRTDTIEFFWVTGPGPFSTFQTGPDNDASGTGKFMYTRNALFQSPDQTTFISPWIDISSLTAPELRFKYHMYGVNIDKLEVRIRSIDGSGQLVKTITGQKHTSGTAPWTLETTSLSSITSDTIRIEFIGNKTSGGFRSEIGIDEIEVSNPQNCSAPTALAVSNITLNSVQLNWTSSGATVGTNIEYGPTGFSPGSGTFIYGVSSPHVVSGLNSSTAYQFYIQDSCAWGGLSTRVGPVSATTLACPPVTAVFTANTNNGLSVGFNATSSTGNIDHYDWDFGDGNTDTTVSPTHIYAAGGTYTITLIVSSDCGSADTTTMTITICEAITPQFTNTSSGLTISLDASATTGTGLSYAWLYGDGNSGTGVTTMHTYAADGNYQVSLIVTDTCGNVDTLIQTLDICNPVQAVINYTQTGLSVLFDGTSSTGAVEWSWFFGDGAQDTASMPSHTYASTGTYQITLYTTNLCGDRDTAVIILTLCDVPQAAWTFNILSSGANGMTVQFDGTASIGANSFMWDFGDGNSNSTSAIPVHTYGVPGLFYVVTLTVENDCGDQSTSSSSLATVGIEDLEQAGLKIYPIPVDDYLTLAIPSFLEVSEISMYALDGKNMLPEIEKGTDFYRINTSAVSAGTYVLKVATNAGEAVYNVVVRH